MSRLVACAALSLLPAGAALAEYALGPTGNTILKNPIAGASQFGYGTTTGDVDGDGTDDLIVSPNGGNALRILRGQAWDVGTTGTPIKFFGSTFEPGVSFRANTPITGDFDGDGRDEIAFGNPSYSASFPSGGRAYVARRDNAGVWDVVTTIQQGNNGYPGVHEAGDSFGNALASGDFDNDGYDDLAIGALGEAVGTVDEAGAVMIEYGTAAGITSARGTLVTRNSDGLTFDPLEGDRFGYALASGDFDADGYDDLAIGATGARCPDGTTKSGAVIVMYGSASGIVTTRSRIFRPGVGAMLGTCTGGTLFGIDLQAAPFDSGLTSDLAIGTYADAVHVVYAGDTGGLATAGNQRFTPADVPGASTGGRFGSKLASGRLRRTTTGLIFGRTSLVVGAPGEAANGLDESGSVAIFHANAGGLTASGVERWTRSAQRNIGAPAIDDRYGSALTTGDYNDDGAPDLAIGVPYYDDGATADDGAVEVLYGSEFIFRDGFEP
ncbi:VCBS repeat-containing protein [Tahibacter soli]|uniref:VCBS repeat-containing protein n=1 Tax=Tahibacter soli TaxID=2983605 RepID=A0A9X3YQY0_9GAMM|nr:VCBS repeat-containing protein [Tahibacter soli]MDC8016114.1 VCBS repeat-containing protein [Tahibacter soli]